MEAIVLIILQIFFATRAVLKIGEYPRIFPSFSWGIFAHVTRLDQSRANENIWWIIITIMNKLNGGARKEQNDTLKVAPYSFTIARALGTKA